MIGFSPGVGNLRFFLLFEKEAQNIDEQHYVGFLYFRYTSGKADFYDLSNEDGPKN